MSDSIKINIITRNGCNWCGSPAPYAVTVNAWTDYACRSHAVEHFEDLWCVTTTNGVRLWVLDTGYAPVNVWTGRALVSIRYRHRATECADRH